MGQERADRLVRDYGVEVEWKAFELHPETPLEGRDVSARYRTAQGSERGSHVRNMAAEVGLAYSPGPILANSRYSLEASEYARAQGAHDAFHRGMFDAYFVAGRNISDRAVVQDVARQAGLDPDDLVRQVDTGRYFDVVEGQLNEARALGISAVPCYLFDSDGYRKGIMGAQSYEQFQLVMEMVLEKRPFVLRRRESS